MPTYSSNDLSLSQRSQRFQDLEDPQPQGESLKRASRVPLLLYTSPSTPIVVYNWSSSIHERLSERQGNSRERWTTFFSAVPMRELARTVTGIFPSCVEFASLSI